MTLPVLYGYYRSSAAYRIRIALGWKDIDYSSRPVHLVKGEQGSADFLALNPQGLVPVLAIDGELLAQSQAILDYLEETTPLPPLLPPQPAARAMVRRMAQLVVADIHPLNNTRVTAYLRDQAGQSEQQVTAWIRHWMTLGLSALERLALAQSAGFCFGDSVTLADCCLIPQLYNAKRFGVDLTAFPTLQSIDLHCATLPAFIAAHPDRQTDAPVG